MAQPKTRVFLKVFVGGIILLGLAGNCATPAGRHTGLDYRHRRLFRADGSGIVDIARRYIGTPYRFGGATPDGFDCSGLVRYVFSRAGYSLPRSATEQWELLKPTRVPQPGDLVFFKINGTKISHVGIYAGNFHFIHAPRTGKTVGLDDIRNTYWRQYYAGSRTVFQ